MLGNSFLMEATLKSLMPMVDKIITDENANKVFDVITETYPLLPDEIRNICTISQEKNNKVYLCVVGIDKNNKILRVKKQMLLVEGIKLLLSSALTTKKTKDDK